MGDPCNNTGWYVRYDHIYGTYFKIDYPPGYTPADDFLPGPYEEWPEFWQGYRTEKWVSQYLADSEVDVVRMEQSMVTDGRWGGLVRISGLKAERAWYLPAREPEAGDPDVPSLLPYLRLTIVMCDVPGQGPSSFRPLDYAALSRLWGEERFRTIPLEGGYGDLTLTAMGTTYQISDPYKGFDYIPWPYPGTPKLKVLGTQAEVENPDGSVVEPEVPDRELN